MITIQDTIYMGTAAPASGGGGSAPVIESLSITPTTSAQTITAPSGTDGYSPINVSAVTAAIDANITAGNIKKDVVILGVIGTYQGSGGYSEIPSYQINNGILSRRTVVLNGTEFSNVTSIANYGLSYIFFNNSNVSGTVNFSNVTSIGNYGMQNAFTNTGITGTVNLSSLTSVGDSGMENAFTGANITGINLSSLTSVSSNALYNTFAANSITGTVDLSSITSIGDRGMSDCFAYNSGITSVDLSSLQTIVNSGLSSAFSETQITSISFNSLVNISFSGMQGLGRGMTSLQSLYFPAITSSTVEDYSFEMMLDWESDGVTVHFPSNMQSVMQNWNSVSSGFNGTNTVILFDLPATS